MEDRRNRLAVWVKQALSLEGSETPDLDPISGDASFRKYFRLRMGKNSFVVVDAPPQSENNRQFALVREMLEANGLSVPRLLAADFDNGFMLVSDFGDETYFQAASDTVRISQLYSCAIDSLGKIQRIDPGKWNIPAYDAAFISRELTIFEEWFVEGLLGIDRFQGFQDVSDYLIDSALQQPQVVMHRDYHSRNLMVIDSASPGILDFQDAVLGPLAYDLASLLKDCYITWPQVFVDEKIDEYLRGTAQLDIPGLADRQQFVSWFDLIALQRHLKCVGIFARLFKRDGKPYYLGDIPRVLDFILTTGEKYDQLAPFHRWLRDEVVPAIELVPELRGDLQ